MLSATSKTSALLAVIPGFKSLKAFSEESTSEENATLAPVSFFSFFPFGVIIYISGVLKELIGSSVIFLYFH